MTNFQLCLEAEVARLIMLKTRSAYEAANANTASTEEEMDRLEHEMIEAEDDYHHIMIQISFRARWNAPNSWFTEVRP